MRREAEVGITAECTGTLCVGEPAVCTSDVVSYHIASFRPFWLVQLERGFCACICICVCAHAQLAVQCCQVSSRASLHSSVGFVGHRSDRVSCCVSKGGVGGSESSVAFVYMSTLRMSMCRRD
jgi:hypothetical protein